MIRLLVLDVDGTMTDGGVYYDSTGNELKKFAIKDGARSEEHTSELQSQ